MTVTIIDNVDPGWEVVSGGWSSFSPGGYGGTFRYASGGAVSSWTFPGLPAIPHRVSITWPPDANRGNAVTIRVYDGDATTGTLIKTRVVDQILAPLDLLATDGADWHDLAVPTPSSGTITVTLEATGSGFAIADAVRVSDSDFPTFPRIKDGQPILGPERNLLYFLCESTTPGHEGEPALVSAASGGTIRWDGPDAGSIDLVRHLWWHKFAYVMCVLSRRHCDAIDDADATTSGTWATDAFPSGQEVVFGDSRQSSADPDATITYTFADVTPNRYELRSSVLKHDESYCPDATIEVYDGAVDPGNLVATIAWDQTASRSVRDFDDVEQQFRLQTLGAFTVPAGTAGTLNVVQSNGSGTGTLVADCLKIESIHEAPYCAVPESATNVRLDSPDEWITTTAGTVVGETGRAIAVVSDLAEFYGYLPDSLKTLILGFNAGLQNTGNCSRGVANLLYGSPIAVGERDWSLVTTGPWSTRSGGAQAICDANGNMTGLTAPGVVGQQFSSQTPNGTDALSITSIPANGTVRCLYDTPNPSYVPTFVKPADRESVGLVLGSLVGPMLDPYGSGQQVCTMTYAVPPGEGSSLAVRAAYPLDIITDGCAANLRVTVDEVTPPDWPHETDPVLYAWLHGFGFPIRVGNALQTLVGARNHVVSDRTTDDRVNCTIPSFTARATLVAIHPVDLTEADTDGIRRTFNPDQKRPLIKVELAGLDGDTAPATRFTPGILSWFRGLSENGWPDTAGDNSPIGVMAPGTIYLDIVSFNVSLVVATIDDTHLLISPYTTTSFPGETGQPEIITLAASHTFTSGEVVQPHGIGDSDPLLFRRANELGTPLWYNLPHACTEEYAYATGFDLAQGLTPGIRVDAELGNEIWNGGADIAFGQAHTYFAYEVIRRQWDHDHADDPSTMPYMEDGAYQKAYAITACERPDSMRQGWIDGGGDPALFSRVLGAHHGDAGGTTRQQVDMVLAEIAAGRPRTFEKLAIGTYQSNAPLDEFYTGDDAARAYADCDVATLCEMASVHIRHGGVAPLISGHTDELARLPFPVDLVSYEGGPEALCPAGDRQVQRSLAVGRHPNWWWVEMGWSQYLQDVCGFKQRNRYFLCESDQVGNGVGWATCTSINPVAGTGTAGENSNPFAVDRVSQGLGAAQAWMTQVNADPGGGPVAGGSALLMGF